MLGKHWYEITHHSSGPCFIERAEANVHLAEYRYIAPFEDQRYVLSSLHRSCDTPMRMSSDMFIHSVRHHQGGRTQSLEVHFSVYVLRTFLGCWIPFLVSNNPRIWTLRNRSRKRFPSGLRRLRESCSSSGNTISSGCSGILQPSSRLVGRGVGSLTYVFQGAFSSAPSHLPRPARLTSPLRPFRSSVVIQASIS